MVKKVKIPNYEQGSQILKTSHMYLLGQS